MEIAFEAVVVAPVWPTTPTTDGHPERWQYEEEVLVKTISPATVPAAWPTWAKETESWPAVHSGAEAGLAKYPATPPLPGAEVVLAELSDALP